MKYLLTFGLLIIQNLSLLSQTETPPTLNPYFSAVIVQNMDTSVKWYSEILGYEVLNQTENKAIGFKQANLQRDNALLELIELKTAIFSETILKDQPKRTRIGGFFKLGFEVPNFDEWMEFLTEKEVEIHGDVVTDSNSGKRMVIIKDPDGNRIQLFDAFAELNSEHAEQIRRDLSKYFRLMSDEKLSESMNYIHPGLFEYVPKETMVEMIGSMFEDPDLKMGFDSVQVTDISEVVTVEKSGFAKVGHQYQLTMKPREWEAGDKLDLMVTGLKLNYGEENVKVDESEKIIRIRIEGSMIAFLFEDSEHWYFLENKSEMKGLHEQLVPAEVAEKLDLK